MIAVLVEECGGQGREAKREGKKTNILNIITFGQEIVT